MFELFHIGIKHSSLKQQDFEFNAIFNAISENVDDPVSIIKGDGVGNVRQNFARHIFVDDFLIFLNFNILRFLIVKDISLFIALNFSVLIHNGEAVGNLFDPLFIVVQNFKQPGKERFGREIQFFRNVFAERL